MSWKLSNTITAKLIWRKKLRIKHTKKTQEITKDFPVFVIYIHNIKFEVMGLLDAEYKIEVVLNEEYFVNNNWQRIDNHSIGVMQQKGVEIVSLSWIKLIINENCLDYFSSRNQLWIRYDESTKTLYNLNTGARFTSDDVWLIEGEIENWTQSYF